MQKTEIKFGTDGFRGIIAKDFTFEVLERIISALGLYLRNLKQNKNTVIVGYDPRFMAHDFAKFTAELLKDFGFSVVLSSKVVPTPIVAYCAKYYKNSLGAVMITASHNPKEYQGIKFIPNYGGPAEKEITDEILKFLDKKIEKKEGGEIIKKNLEDAYILHLEKIIDFEAIQKNPPKIIYDGLYSSSVGYFDKILDKYKIPCEKYNAYYSSDFGGGLPEPKPDFMKYKKQGFITVANDGDADRYGVINEEGNYVSPNIILAILLKYLSKKGLKGAMIKTVGVSNIVDVVAKKLNIQTITTPVGFKWLSSAMRNNKTILAGEESGGLSTGEHIFEKDGIFANLLIIEMLSKENKTLVELEREIKEFALCEFFTDRVDIKLDDEKTAAEIMKKYSSIEKINNFKVKDKLEIDGIKFFLQDNLTSLLIRKSGTEPLLRFYIESNKKEILNIIKEHIQKQFS